MTAESINVKPIHSWTINHDNLIIDGKLIWGEVNRVDFGRGVENPDGSITYDDGSTEHIAPGPEKPVPSYESVCEDALKLGKNDQRKVYLMLYNLGHRI